MSVLYRLKKSAALGTVLAAVSTIALADNPPATINVNANGNRHAISP